MSMFSGHIHKSVLMPSRLMTDMALLVASTMCSLAAATPPPFPRLYTVNFDGGVSDARADCAAGQKVLGGGCNAVGNSPTLFDTSFPKSGYYKCSGFNSNKQIRMTCVDEAYAPTQKDKESNNQWAIAECNAGQKAIGGGCKGNNVYAVNTLSGGFWNAWTCGGAGLNNAKAFVLCVDQSTELTVKESTGGDWVTVSCDAGQQAVSGGCEVLSSPWKHQRSWPTADRSGWTCGGFGRDKKVKAICVRTTTTTTTSTATMTTSSVTTSTTTKVTTSTTTTILYSIVNRRFNLNLIPNDTATNSTCPKNGLWRISNVSDIVLGAVSVEAHMGPSRGWLFLGHIGRGLLLGRFGGPSFTWRLAGLGNDTYTVQSSVEDNSANSFLAHSADGEHIQLESSAEDERAEWIIAGLPPQQR